MNSRILKKNMIPNYLTVLRMVLAIIVICFLIFPFGPVLYTLKNPTNCDFRVSFFLAGIFFVIASFSDYLDGYLARKYK
ncbi:hypothetical protein FACS189459_3210 [Bacilli bacterium]|nr:hypothetical protein FACS189459_3210 [Bacilli bacterium]